jgi:NAD kinase
MKTYTIVGQNSEEIDKIFKQKKYIRDDKKPDLVISYGGDGTLLKSEHEYPSVPKLFLRNSRIGNLGFKENNEEVLDLFFKEKLVIKKYFKIESCINNNKFFAVNEFSIKTRNPRHSLRVDVYINKNQKLEHVIGDGLIVSTPIGSTGYYKSITRSTFQLGIGLAFNNTTEQYNHIVLKEDSIIKVVIVRGPAFCYVDNHDDEIDLKVGDEIVIQKSKKFLRMYGVK